jgi:hypothetical protein
MNLTPEQIQKTVTFLQDKLKVCPVCGTGQFKLDGEVGGLATVVEGASGALGRTFPLLLLICVNCFHVIPFAAIPLGIVPTKREGPSEPPPLATVAPPKED